MTEGDSETAHNDNRNFSFIKRIVAIVFIDDNYDSDQDAQIYVSTIGNAFGIILELIGQDRGISAITNIFPLSELRIVFSVHLQIVRFI